MRPLVTRTRQQLSELASPDEFEVLATAVLREADPTYASLLHVGTNASGRAVRSPVDGIDIRAQPDGHHLVLVQHTITARQGLRRKWLDEKDGDVTKAKAIYTQETARNAVLGATLVLTCSIDPDQQLIRDVHAAVGDGLRVDLWPGSRIADFLDRNPEGQWLREQQFGTEVTRLSLTQARAISQQSLNDYLPLVAREDTVPRILGTALAQFTRQSRGAGFVIGESGQGKSTALRRLGDEWYAQGGIVLILPHEVIEQVSTIEQAVALSLRYWAPGLDLACGHAALAFATPERPILLIVEDVNRSSNPRRIVERLVSWSASGRSDGQDITLARQWRLLCPVWRSNAGVGDTQLHELVMRDSLMVDRFERSEAIEAIRIRANRAGVTLTALQSNDLAVALGDDPLLIGLNRDWFVPNPRGAIQSYIGANINDVADDRLLPSDLQHALDELAERLVEGRVLYPNWRQIRTWLARDNDSLMAIRRLVDQGRIIHLGTTNNNEQMAYRHDRVRDHLLTQAVTRMIENGRFTADLWADPFYAGLIGGALFAAPKSAVINAAMSNPAALFAALQEASLTEERRRQLIQAAQGWVKSAGFEAGAIEQQRHHAMRFLSRIEGPFVADLAGGFPFSFPKLEALVRNGSARAGAAICARLDPGIDDIWRDRMIDHARARHPGFLRDLADLFRSGEMSPDVLEGALNLAGEIGDASLCDALAARWACGDRMTLSTGWLWAAIRCCAPVNHPLADTLCDLWAELPTEAEKAYLNPRWDIAGYTLPHAFNRRPERSAIAFLVERGKRDRNLNHVLSSILRQVDSPEAVLFSVRHGAEIYRRTEQSGGINLFLTDLKRTWCPKQHGRVLSVASRTAVEQIWRNPLLDRFQRKTAFLLWCQTPTRDEVADISVLETDVVLADAALRTRLVAGDQSAVPLLKQRIWETDNGKHWWYEAWGVGLVGLHEDVRRYFAERRTDPHAAGHDAGADRIIAELLMDTRDQFATQTIIANWDQLKTSPLFVQAALYLAVPATVKLAQLAIADSEAPDKLLEHIDWSWGIRTVGRKGVTDLAQLEALEPYYVRMSQAEMGHIRIQRFFAAANSLGALAWREKHLDPLIDKTDHRCCTSDKSTLFASLDGEMESYLKYNRRWFSIDHWFERREEELWQRGVLLSVIASWTSARGSEPAVRLLCEALLHFGDRQDLALLDQLSPTLRSSCVDTIANCIYGVRRRSLIGSGVVQH